MKWRAASLRVMSAPMDLALARQAWTQAQDADNHLLMLHFIVKDDAASSDMRPHQEVVVLHCMLPQLTQLKGAKAVSAGPPCSAAWTTCSPVTVESSELIGMLQLKLGLKVRSQWVTGLD